MPVQSPDPFQKMSVHADSRTNPYVGRLISLQETKELPVIHGSNLRPMVGKWRELFALYFPARPVPKKLFVEIGCHYGRTLADVAADHPFEPVNMDVYYIAHEKCTECVGFHDEPQCAAVCPVDCCVDDPDYRESEDELLAKKNFMHL